MITKTRVSVVAMVLIAVLALMYTVSAGLNIPILTKTQKASFVVDETHGLLLGSKVLIRGTPAGHVTGITPTADGVEIAWDYPRDQEIPVDTNYRVDNLSALGEAYVSVNPVALGGPVLEDGARIERSRVTVPTSFNELAEKLTELLRQVDPEHVDTIFEVVDGSLPEEATVINNLEVAGRILADEFHLRTDTLTTLLATMQPLLARSDGVVAPGMAGATPNLEAFGDGAQEMIDSIEEAVVLGGPLLDGIRYGASPMLAELQIFLDNSSEDIGVIGTNLLPATQSAAAAIAGIDTSQLLSTVLEATETPGELTVRVPTR